MVSFFIKLFSVIFLVFIQVSIIPSLFPPLNNLQVYISIIVIMTIMLGRIYSFLPWVILFGTILSFYSIYGVLLIPILLFVIVVISNFFSLNFFTNKSLYSVLILTVLISAIFNLILFILRYFLDFLYFNNNHIFIGQFLTNLLFTTFVNSVFSIILFFIIKKVVRGQ